MNFEIDLNTLLLIFGFAGGYYTLKSDVRFIKDGMLDIRKTLYGTDGRNGAVSDITEIKQQVKACPLHNEAHRNVQ